MRKQVEAAAAWTRTERERLGWPAGKLARRAGAMASDMGWEGEVPDAGDIKALGPERPNSLPRWSVLVAQPWSLLRLDGNLCNSLLHQALYALPYRGIQPSSQLASCYYQHKSKIGIHLDMRLGFVGVGVLMSNLIPGVILGNEQH